MSTREKSHSALSTDERRQLRHEAEAELVDLHDQISELRDRARPLAELIDELRTLDNLDSIAGRTTDEVFADPELLHELAQQEWNNGRGSRGLHAYLETAFRGLAPGVSGFEREVAEDYRTVTRLMPRLYLRYQQDVVELAAALQRVYPSLAVDGIMKVDILEHTCGEYGSWRMEMSDATSASLLRNRSEERSGDLENILRYVARHMWGFDGPEDLND